MNLVSVAVEEIDGRAQVVLTVEEVDSGLGMETIFPTATNVLRLAESLVAAADQAFPEDD
jgi:hypothetical protein